MEKKDYETKTSKETKNNGMRWMKEKEQSPLGIVNKGGRCDAFKKRYPRTIKVTEVLIFWPFVN